MDKVGSPRGLIRYTTQHALTHEPTRILRPRVIIYATLLLVLASAWVTGLVLRKPVAVDVIRDRNALYRMLEDGRVEDVYDVKIMNKTEDTHRYRISVKGAGDLRVDPEPATFVVRAGEVFPAGIRVRRPAYEPEGSETIELDVEAEDDHSLHASAAARFIAPAR
jgi:polyferredoxin